MNQLLTFLYAIISLCAGQGLGSLIRLIFGAIAKKKQKPSVTSLMCLFLSLGVACFSISLFLPGIKEFLIFTKWDFIYYGIIFASGILLGLFFNVMIIVLVVFYLIFTGYNFVLLSTNFPTNFEKQGKNVLVKIDSKFLELQNTFIPLEEVQKNEDGNFLVEVDVFRLKEKNLCPFARNYYSFPAVKNEVRFTRWPLQNNLIGSNQRVKIELKGAEILPALYSINVNRKFTSIEFDCVKSF